MRDLLAWIVGTVLFGVAWLILLISGWGRSAGNEWLMWVCVAGFVGGLAGIVFFVVRMRRQVRRAA